MNMQMYRVLLLALVLFSSAALSVQHSPESAAAPIATDPFQRTWARTDQPVASGAVSRTWMWGLEPFTAALWEDYQDAPGGTRQVQYFDKSRMEITDPGAVDDGVWYVTNGLLVVEMMTGELQTGNEERAPRAPAQINVAGDPGDPLTYAVLGQRRFDAPLAVGAAVTQRIDAGGQVSDDPSLSSRGVTVATLVTETNHTVASVFWDFMHSAGLVRQGEQTVTAPLFESAFYATGLPITEAYWATVTIGGTPHEVLVQCFERRCLTYAPNNPAGWQVEAGNVGQHYYRWRYPEAPAGPSTQANELARQVTQAASDEARYEALLDVMDALHVGVYSAEGGMIVGGAERGAADFYLYDVEVRMMAGALGRGQTYGAVDLAMQLTAMGLLPEGQTLDPNVVRSAILTIIQQARQSPGDFTSLSPLLVRQLALSQPVPVDLFGDVSLHALRLDPLSYFLLLAHATVPLIEEHLPLTIEASSDLVAQSHGVLKAAQSAGFCSDEWFVGEVGKHSSGWLRNAADLMGLLPQAAAKAGGIIDALHGAILSYSVGVEAKSDRAETHYGPSGHESEAGQPMTFTVTVTMRDQLPQEWVECGWLLGIEFPNKGGIPGVSVHWFWDNLDEHGQINCGNACGQSSGNGLALEATNGAGEATMTFQPKDETVDPDEGWIVEEQGIVTGVALYQSKFANLMGAYAQYMTPKSGTTRWAVKWHEVPGWDVEMKVTYDVTQHGAWSWSKGSLTYKGRIESTGFGEYYEQPVFPATISGSGSGSYGLEKNPPVNCSWSGSWSWDEHAVEVLNREQLIVDFLGTLGWKFTPSGTIGTSHQGSGDCAYGWDLGAVVAFHPPAFSLTTDETQVIEVAAPAANLEGGSIVWEITVTPITQP